jgi:Uma2 family endonuclease
MLELSGRRRRFTAEEYLLIDERSETRSEFYDGEIFAMSGGTLDHNRILNNISRNLAAALEGRCEVFTSDVRLLIEAHGLYTYPDVMVVCGPPRMLAGRKDTVLSAQVIFEILSPKTEDYDRGSEADFYRALPELQQIVLVAQDEKRVETMHRQGPEAWLLTDKPLRDGELPLPSLGLTLSLSSIYSGLSL